MTAANAGQYQVLTGGTACCSGAAAFAWSATAVSSVITCSTSAPVDASGGLAASGEAANTPNPRPALAPAPVPRRRD
jgi:hypothetical protein